MAENEILDVGSARRFRAFRGALLDGASNTPAAAEELRLEFTRILRKQLRRNPLHLVLRACDSVPIARRAAIDALKDGSLGRTVEMAVKISGSKNEGVVARTMFELLSDKVVDRAVSFANRQKLDSQRLLSIEAAIRGEMEGCKSQVIHECEAALRGMRLPVNRQQKRREKPDARTIASTSLTR